MPFVARCLYCRRETLAPDEDVGRSVRCHGCDSYFVLVPELNVAAPAVAAVPQADDRAGPVPAPPDATAPPPGKSGRKLSSLDFDEPLPPRPPAGESAADPGVGGGLWWLAGAACLAAVLAGVAASVGGLTMLTVPFAAAGLVCGAVAVARFAARGASGLEVAVPAIPTAGCGFLLFLAVVAPDWISPQYESDRQRGDDPGVLRVVPLGGELIPSDQLAAPDAGVDAVRFALQRSGVRVRVLAAAVGPLPLDTKKPSVTKERYLTVEVAFQNVGGEPVTVVPWGATTPRAVPAAKLTSGKAVEPTDPGAAVKGRFVAEVVIPPGGAATARLTFPDTPLADVLTLELPAEAWGQTGTFKFRLPRSLVAVTAGKGK